MRNARAESGAPRGAIRIDPGVNGGVSVYGWDRADILVRARIDTAADTDSDARAMTSQIRVASGGGDIAAAGPETDRHHNWSVSYEIFAPRQSDIQAKAHNGGIKIADVRGNIEFDTVNGGVTLTRLSGEVHGRTTNGGLTVELAGDRWDGRGMDVTTTNGGVKLDVPSNYSAHFETATVNGGNESRFPGDGSGTADQRHVLRHWTRRRDDKGHYYEWRCANQAVVNGNSGRSPSASST